jgi:predicted kinase
VLIVVSGLPGTGKSAIADALSRTRGLPVLSVDPIEAAIVQAGIEHGFETGLAAYLVAEVLADAYLAAAIHPIVDAVNAVDVAREQWRRLAQKHEVPLRVIECVIGDETVHAARLASRDRGLAIPEPSWADVEQRRAEWTPWPEPHLTLDATDDLDANIAKADAYIGNL